MDAICRQSDQKRTLVWAARVKSNEYISQKLNDKTNEGKARKSSQISEHKEGRHAQFQRGITTPWKSQVDIYSTSVKSYQ